MLEGYVNMLEGCVDTLTGYVNMLEGCVNMQ